MATEAFCIQVLQCDLSFKTIGHIHDIYDSGENKVTMSLSTVCKLKNMPGYGGNRTYGLTT